MAKRFSTQMALEIIFEERVALEEDNVEEFSEYKDHISVSSESHSEFEEEDKIGHLPVLRTAHQQPASREL